MHTSYQYSNVKQCIMTQVCAACCVPALNLLANKEYDRFSICFNQLLFNGGRLAGELWPAIVIAIIYKPTALPVMQWSVHNMTHHIA